MSTEADGRDLLLSEIAAAEKSLRTAEREYQTQRELLKTARETLNDAKQHLLDLIRDKTPQLPFKG